MTRDDIIRMAREAGFKVGTNISGVVLVGSPREFVLAHLDIEELGRFAELVAAAEREECAKVCEERGRAHRYGAVVRLKIKECVDAIRARGKQK